MAAAAWLKELEETMGERFSVKKLAAKVPAALSRFRSAPRPFLVQAKPAQEPDLDARLRDADRFGHHLESIQLTAGRTSGLPDRLRRGIEALSGLPMRDVRVHYNSAKPRRLQAFAFAQGRDIHLAPGQERHLPHEAWHVVQQKQRRVRPSLTLQGMGINDDQGLEGEADVMGKRASQTGGGGGPAMPGAPGPAVSPGGFPGPGAAQRVTWQWDHTNQTWSAVGGSSSSSKPPTHKGSRHGEIFDDEYSPASDPTVKPFLKKGERLMGEAAVQEQLKGNNPPASKVRVSARTFPNTRQGVGMHEVVPTNMKKFVADSKNKALIGAQAGMRTSTGRQMFNQGVHTGFAINPKGKGSTHTKGQAASHDFLREAVKSVKSEPDPHKVINTLGLAHVQTMPTGPAVMQNTYLTGMLPNQKSINTIGNASSSSSSGAPDPERLKLAQMEQQMREETKTRLRSVKRSSGKGRSPSPPRADVDSKGSGGGHLPIAPKDYPVLPVPSFGDPSKPSEYSAAMGSWTTAPQREGFDFSASSSAPSATTTTTTTTPATSSAAATVIPPMTMATAAATATPVAKGKKPGKKKPGKRKTSASSKSSSRPKKKKRKSS